MPYYSDEYIRQKLAGNPWTGAVQGIGSTAASIAFPAYGAGKAVVGIGQGLLDAFNPVDQYGVSENTRLAALSKGLDPFNMILDDVTNFGSKSTGNSIGQLAMDIFAPYAGAFEDERNKKSERDRLLKENKNYLNEQKNLQRRFEKMGINYNLTKPNMSACKGGKIGKMMRARRKAKGGNVYLDNQEIIVPYDNQEPQMVSGGNKQDIGGGLYQVNANNQGSDQIKANVSQAKIISDDLGLAKPLKIVQEKINEENKFLEGQTKKLSKPRLTSLQQKSLGANITNSQRRLEELESMKEKIIDIQPDYPEAEGEYKKGGIHIKKANKGLFTDYCGGKVTGECIAKGLRSPDPAVRKRANFARNARGWSHKQEGGVTPSLEELMGFTPINLIPNESLSTAYSWNNPRNINLDITTKPGTQGSLMNFLKSPDSTIPLAQTAYGLATGIGSLLTPVDTLDVEKIPTIGRLKEQPLVRSTSNKYLRGTPLNLSALGLSPNAILQQLATNMGIYSQAAEKENLINSEITGQNINRDLQRRGYNIGVNERNTQNDIYRQVYEAQGESAKANQISQSVASLLAGLAKIGSYAFG